MKKIQMFRSRFILTGFLFLFTLVSSLAFSQVTIGANTGLNGATSDLPNLKVGLFQSTAMNDCSGSVTFSTAAATDWVIYNNGINPFPTGVMKDGASSVIDGYTRSGISSLTLTLKSLTAGTYGFGIQTGVASFQDVILVVSGLCVSTPMPVLSITVTKNTGSDCIGTASTLPTYSIHVCDGLTTGNRTYNLALTGTVPAGLAINGGNTIVIPTGMGCVDAVDKIGGQTTSAPLGTYPFKVQVSDTDPSDGTAATIQSTDNTVSVSAACQNNALVVMVDPSGGGTAAPQPILLMPDVKDWVKRASFDRAIFNPFIKSGVTPDQPIVLANAFSTYSTVPKTVLKDLVGEVVTKLLTTNAALHTGPNALDNVKYLILFLNTTSDADVGSTGYWAINSMTYPKPGGGTVTLGVSIHKNNPDWKEVAHGVAHQFGMKDLNVYVQDPMNPNVGTFQPVANTPTGWDIMAIPASGISGLKNIHPVAENKFFATGGAWVGGIAAGTPKVEFVTKASAAGPVSKTIMAAKDYTAGASMAVAAALQLSSGASSLATEKTYVWIEARPHVTGDDVDQNPFDGVIVYYANQYLNTDGSGRVQAYDMDASGGVQIYYPAGKHVVTKIGNTGWSLNKCDPDGSGHYTIEVVYSDPPAGSFDADVVTGTTVSWLSSHIETVIPGCKSCPSTAGAVEGSIAGDIDTKVIAHVYNSSGTSSADVIVKFSVGRGSVTGVSDLTKATFATVFATLPPHTTTLNTDVFGILNLAAIEGAAWGPDLIAALNANTTHYCLYVDIEPITPGDANMSNHSAQKNSHFYENTHASPYGPINYEFFVSNPEDKPRLVLFDVKNVPGSWNFTLTPDRVLLAPKEDKRVQMLMQAPANYPACSDIPVQIASFTPVDHTLVPLGGIMDYVQMRNKENITIGAQVTICNPGIAQGNNYNVAGAVRPGNTDEAYTKATYPGLAAYISSLVGGKDKNNQRGCATITTNGCTNPKRPNTTIYMIYQDPAGNPVYKEVMTDSSGCFTDDFVAVEGGDWTTTAMFPGDGCNSSADSAITVHVNLPVTHDQDGDGLPDKDEFQGDYDGDGIPGQLDPDSDNDGIKDGDELPGNCDCDSYANVIDPDSDNDGIPDGKDPTPYGNIPMYRAFISAMFHRFDFDKKLPVHDGFGFNIRAGVNLHPRWGIEAEFGLTPTHDILEKKGVVYNINLNGLYYINNGPVVPYLTAGLGELLFKQFTASSSTFAVNGGAGVLIPPAVSLPGFMIRAEVKAHYGFGGYNTNGNLNIQYSLGLTYRIHTKSAPCKIQKMIKESHRKK